MTYARESLFSVLNHSRSKTRHRLTVKDSTSYRSIASQTTARQPDIKKRSSNICEA